MQSFRKVNIKMYWLLLLLSVNGQKCGQLWEQCDGLDFKGPKCCQTGSICFKQDQWYSQCRPSSGGPGGADSGCGKLWDQCDGLDFKGSKCCQAGASCFKQDQWYSQCRPSSGGAGGADSGCGNLWDQCDGLDFKGPKCCQPGASCVKQDQWYSQCKPSSSDPSPTATYTVTITTTTTSTPSSGPTPPPSNEPRMLSPQQMNAFVKVNGTKLTLLDKTFYYSGTNSYELFYIPRPDIDSFFRDVVKTQGTVVRTWLFSDGKSFPAHPPNIGGIDYWFQDIDRATGEMYFNDDSETGLGRFDYVLASARAHGIKLIVTLTNNWQEFGGMDVYNDRVGSEKHYHSDFYSEKATKAQFKKYITHVLERTNQITNIKYKDDATIMAIELANEARCVGSNPGQYPPSPNCNSTTLTKWVDEISLFIKSIDKKHLVAIGDEGFFDNQATNGYPSAKEYPNAYSNIFDGTSGMDFYTNGKLPGVDILGIHSYLDSWGTRQDPLWLQNTMQWLKDHADMAKKIGKPLYLGEYGLEDPTQRKQDWPIIQKAMEDLDYAGTNTWIMLGDAFGGKCYPSKFLFIDM